MHSLPGDFVLDVNITKIEKGQLLSLENPQYNDMLQKYSHLQGVHMDNDERKYLLPIHIILGANDYAKIRLSASVLVGQDGDPVVQHTKFGWPLCLLEQLKKCLTVNSTTDYDNLTTYVGCSWTS